MERTYKQSTSPFTRYYKDNAVMQLIIAHGVAFVLFHFIVVIMRVMQFPEIEIITYVYRNISLPLLPDFGSKFWTILTYGFVHQGFLNLLSNMLWLYAFGSVVQSLVGHRQIVPLYIYSLVIGGIFYFLAQLLPGATVRPGFMGSIAGLMSLVVASVTIAPHYRFYFAPHFSVPILVLAGIFAVLSIVFIGTETPKLFLLGGGALSGFVYIKVLRAGYSPSDWIYNMFNKVENTVTPREATLRKQGAKRTHVLNSKYEPKQGITQSKIDDILDKINTRGYNSLTKEEKEILLRASKEN